MDNQIKLGESLLDVVQGKLQNPEVAQKMLLSRMNFDDVLLTPQQRPKKTSGKSIFKRMAAMFESKVYCMNRIAPLKPLPKKTPVPAALERTFAETERIVSEIKRQAKTSFNAALLLILCGTLLAFGGIFMLYKDQVLTGWVTTAAGTVTDLLSGGIMMLYKSTNKRLDQANHDMAVLSKVRAQYALIELIADEAVRTEELRKLIGSLYEEK